MMKKRNLHNYLVFWAHFKEHFQMVSKITKQNKERTQNLDRQAIRSLKPLEAQ